MAAGSAIIIVVITFFFPPLGAYLVAGCGADLFINICLTILGVLPGHLHAYYLEYVYFDRQEKARTGHYTATHAPGIYSDRVQSGGTGYGTIVQNT